MSFDARARTGAPFACDKAVWIQAHPVPNNDTTNWHPSHNSPQPGLQRCGTCLPPPGHRFCRPHLLSALPASTFSSGHESKEIMLQKDTPAGGNRSLQGLPIALRSQVRHPPSVLPAPALHCTLQNTQDTQSTKSYSRATSRANGRRPERPRHARHTQGKNITPRTCTTLEPAPKSCSPLENLKIGKKNRLNHCDGHPRKPQVPLLPLECLRRPTRPLTLTLTIAKGIYSSKERIFF